MLQERDGGALKLGFNFFKQKIVITVQKRIKRKGGLICFNFNLIVVALFEETFGQIGILFLPNLLLS